MKRIYLDVCSLCRPFDDQNYVRIRIETDSINLILSRVKEKYYELMKSPVHIVVEVSWLPSGGNLFE